MRKIITVLATLLLFVSCKTFDRKPCAWEVTYTVYYTTEVNKTITTTVTGREGDEIKLSSYHGTNTLYLQDQQAPGRTKDIFTSTAPIELVSCEIIYQE